MSLLDQVSYQDCESFAAKVTKSDYVKSASAYVTQMEIIREDGARPVIMEEWLDASHPVGSMVTVELYAHPTDPTRKPLVQVIAH